MPRVGTTPLAEPEGLGEPPERRLLLPELPSARAGLRGPAARGGVQLEVGGLAELLPVLDRPEVVRTNHLGQLVAAVAGPLLGPSRDLDVLLDAEQLRQRLVRDVADQDVAERELELAGEDRRLPRRDASP